MDMSKYESSVNLELSSDKLVAFVSLKTIYDDEKYVPEDLESYIRKQGIVHGLLHDHIRSICKEPIQYMNRKIEVAKGEPAGKGIDGSVVFVDVEDKHRESDNSDNDVIDFKQVTKLDNVKRGQLIARLIPPQTGPSGLTVTGETVPGVIGKPARFKVGKNVVVNAEGNLMYSAIDGLISLTDKDKINVFPVFEVKGDVDYRVGNIDFVGTVVIRGNVLTGFKVNAAGDIRVIGGVEGAELNSGGSIEITGGIMASGKGMVTAAQNIKCSFIQDANITAGGDVHASQSILHSIVKAGQKVICDSSKGLIVGGVIQASDGVSAKTIGNAMSTATTIEVGVHPEHRNEQLNIRASIKEQTEHLDRTEKALVILDQLAATGKLTPDRLAMRQKLIHTKNQTTVLINDLKDRMLEIEKQLEDSELATVSIKNQVFGGVKIVIGRYTRYIKDSTSSVVFKYEDGEIVMVPYY
ncbi:DUF342 domain-containing protein [Paenibacillus camelliae]|uniref:DUF342 domain-containing protein n=1 Tax=Paenibacillus camelliae TaxID=512410 RepID=UPI00203E6742|nr:FapA family protein [Paenibacillus camelliae]MCM3632011.1 FapA family protein [Paenibacillus camelliae]